MVKRILTLIGFCILTIFMYLLFFQEETVMRRYAAPYIAEYELPLLDSLEASVDSWQCINQSACIYSAYWDERFYSPLVRLVAVIHNKANLSSWKCLFKYNDSTSKEASLKVELIPEGHNKKHKAVYLLCKAAKRPEEVEIVAGLSKTSSIIVHTTKLEDSAKGNLAFCVRPIFGSFPNNNSIVAEFIAYYQELGADHFIFYDYKSDFSVKLLMYELMEDGFPIDFLPWNLPEEFSDAWANGQMAFGADCLYRNSQNYEFVATLDVDEFIVPKQDISLKKLLEILSKKNSKWGTYMFRQTFFCVEYEDDPSSVNLTIPLITQIKTRHESKLWPYSDRSKCIVRPIAVVTPGIHYTWKHIKSWKTLQVNANQALLHHYRGSKCKIKKGEVGILERIALRYGKRILDSPAIQIWRTFTTQTINATLLSRNNFHSKI